jgi:hypothetical protein
MMNQPRTPEEVKHWIKTYKWVKIDTQGVFTEMKVKSAKGPALEELQGVVGGYIEQVSMRKGYGHRMMIVNEEGILMQLKPNEMARAIAEEANNTEYFILGDVVVMQG